MAKPNGPYLPDDYADLTKKGQIKARVHAVSTWKTPDEHVKAWELFRQLYFLPTKPKFFYKYAVKSSPRAHYQWVHDYMAYQFNIMGGPRHSAKSQVMGREIPIFHSLTMPRQDILLILCSNDLMDERFDELKLQFEENEFLRYDFGRIKPVGRGRAWRNGKLVLPNGAILSGTSIESRNRGKHPHEIIIDDPEFDPNSKEGTETKLFRDMQTFLMRVLMPMIEEGEDGRIWWQGTLINRRAALWQAYHGEDERFEQWNRRLYSMTTKNEDGTVDLFWESRWDTNAITRKKETDG